MMLRVVNTGRNMEFGNMAAMKLAAEIFWTISMIIHSSSHVGYHAVVSRNTVVLQKEYEVKIHEISPPKEQSANASTALLFVGKQVRNSDERLFIIS